MAPVLPSSSVPANALGNSATIPVKIINGKHKELADLLTLEFQQ